jgi:phosphatidylglycerol:prolipoprotein diacylglycerol transferase
VEQVPTSVHLGPLTFHLYGLGLAIAAYVGVRYGRHRFAERGLDLTHFNAYAIWLVVAGFAGARIAHVATNWHLYSSDPLRIFAVWQGGLASFGALALAAPLGYVLARRWWGGAGLLNVADAAVPALVLAWAVGRFLGPQFMVAGGGHLTHQWFGLRYHGQVGKRVPVPIIQGLEDLLLFFGLIYLDRRDARRHPGLVTGVALVIWGVVRSLDERLLLGQEGQTGSVGVQIAGLALALIGVAILVKVSRDARTPVPN